MAGRLRVRTLGGRSGVRVNGQAVIAEQDLQNADRVDFGPVSYQVVGRHLELLSRPEGMRVGAAALAVARGGQTLLSGVQLTIAANQFVGILGASGAGKTSLLKCLAGYYPPAVGQVIFDGVATVAGPETGRSEVGYVPQEDVLYSLLTGRENLDFGLHLRATEPMAAEERAGIIADVLERVQLTGHADKLAAVLSGGQRRRLNVALELLTRPRLLLLDEPTSGLDPAGETRLMRLLKELAGRGVTVVCSTHVLANVELFDQVLVVAEGTVIYGGLPGQLLAHFGVPGYGALYEALEDRPVRPAWPTASVVPDRSSPGLPHIPTITPVASPGAEMSPRVPVLTQVAVQVQRGARLVGRDRPLLAMLIAQPVLIGLLINLAQLRPTGLKPIFLFCVVTAIWLGLNNTAREVVRDRPTYVRSAWPGRRRRPTSWRNCCCMEPLAWCSSCCSCWWSGT